MAGTAEVAAVQHKVNEVQGVMQDNVNVMIDNMAKTEVLEDKSASLADQAATFKKTAKSTRQHFLWQLIQQRLVLAGIGALFLIILVIMIASNSGGGDGDGGTSGSGGEMASSDEADLQPKPSISSAAANSTALGDGNGTVGAVGVAAVADVVNATLIVAANSTLNATLLVVNDNATATSSSGVVATANATGNSTDRPASGGSMAPPSMPTTSTASQLGSQRESSPGGLVTIGLLAGLGSLGFFGWAVLTRQGPAGSIPASRFGEVTLARPAA